ncbi:acyl-CoA dehydrogenase family protein [Mycobacterium sp. EPa45]|uniref:acyl-CoA dehydrogenase family protein n=1 Tax=Mycobacterium sp. EPa45 TaxID=1545728 RepID=UPI000641A4D7|nr:acyl-CoA dehydrogenase family protein [Mycobacterium sp. EPa45]AKK27668.1 acyl-CoA dehydrogenase [Mycobacterium sp. EPa45]
MSELEELREAGRDFLDAKSPSDAVRRLMATEAGFDSAVWTQMAEQLGLHGIAIPDAWGGAGASTVELAVVFEEMGRALLCAPFYSTVALAATAIVNSGDCAASAEFLPGLADGTTRATLILNGRLGPWDATDLQLRAEGARDGTYRICGEAPLVLDGHTADLVLVAAQTEAGVSLFTVAREAAGLTAEPLKTLDQTRKTARLTFNAVEARLIGEDGGAERGLARTSDIATVLLAAEQVGAAARCLDMAVDYAKGRIQFGRPIGSFQAIKHRCADMLVMVEGARSAVVHAAGATDADELAIAASVAKLAASETFLNVALDNMRIHGGTGFTWEHDAHLYVRRAKSSELTFGGPDYHAERLARLVASSR